MASGKWISYLRVSTDKQGATGLGIEAQRAAVTDFLNGGRWKLIKEYVEVESGKRNDRQQLADAVKACRVHGAKLVIAKLDRALGLRGRLGLRAKARAAALHLFRGSFMKGILHSPTSRRPKRRLMAWSFPPKVSTIESFLLTLCHRIFYIPKVRLSKVGDGNALRVREGVDLQAGLHEPDRRAEGGRLHHDLHGAGFRQEHQ